jgi:hypothetical protein
MSLLFNCTFLVLKYPFGSLYLSVFQDLSVFHLFQVVLLKHFFVMSALKSFKGNYYLGHLSVDIDCLFHLV